MANHQTTHVDRETVINQKKDKIKELETRIHEQDTRLSSLQSNAFQLANFYFVFQGVILSAIVSGNSSLRCSDRWFLITLSIIAAVLNLFSLFVIGRNYLRSYDQRDRTWAECNKLHTDVEGLRSSHLRSPPVESNNQGPSTISRVDTWEKNIRTVCFGVCMFLFACFATIVVVGCSIHCRKDDQCKNPTSIHDKCIRLCEGARCMSICTDN